MRRLVSFLAVLGHLAAVALATPPASGTLEGAWTGAITIAEKDLSIRVVFAGTGESEGGTIDIPLQGATGLALSNFRHDETTVQFELAAGPGVVAAFDGIHLDGTITGDFTQAGIKGRFRLAREADAVVATPASPAPAFREIEVSFKSGEVTIAGTLSLPEGNGPFPAAIFLTGSGPQNRDQEAFGFRPFAILAERLNREGVAVLRCDDRGVGGSSGDTLASTLDDYARDADAAFSWLVARPDIDPTRVGFLGHSDGASVASTLAVRRKEVAFLVLLAGPAVKGDALLAMQMKSTLEAEGASQEAIAAELELQSVAIAAVRKGAGLGEIEARVRARVRAHLATKLAAAPAGSDQDAIVEEVVTGQLQMLGSPYFRAFIDHDPQVSLSAVTCPIFAAFGGLDRQVPLEPNRAALDRATEKVGFVFVRTYPSANHLFQTAVTGSPSEYAGLAKEFTPGFLHDLSGFVVRVVRSRRAK